MIQGNYVTVRDIRTRETYGVLIVDVSEDGHRFRASSRFRDEESDDGDALMFVRPSSFYR